MFDRRPLFRRPLKTLQPTIGDYQSSGSFGVFLGPIGDTGFGGYPVEGAPMYRLGPIQGLCKAKKGAAPDYMPDIQDLPRTLPDSK